MPNNDTSALEVARGYIGRGWAPIPVPDREKAPAIKEWQKLRIADKDAPNYFNGGPQNISVLLGEPSGNLVDVDHDTPESRAVAPFFLPTTHAIFGRKSSRTAHYLYVTDRAPGTKAWNDPTAKKDDAKARIVELRGTGGQTVFPGSTHPTGELIEWESAGDPAKVDYSNLHARCEQVAAFALIATHWDTGTRDDLCTATVGFLLRAGFTDDEIQNALKAIAAAADDEKIDTRQEKIERLRGELETGGKVFGLPKLAELTDPKVAAAVSRWLHYKESPEVLVGPAAAVFTAEQFAALATFEVPVIVTAYIIEEAGAIVGPGGEGKSTLCLHDAVRIRLGGKLYGREIVRPGPTLVLTAEDRRLVVGSRLSKICRALNLTDEQTDFVRTGIPVEDVTGAFVRIASADNEGLVKPTALLGEIVDKYRDAGLSQLLLDPTSLLGPGERFGNDGAAELLRCARHLSERLKCAVRLVHHVSQAVYRERIKDQYAARGGTAFVDGSRFQHQLLVVDNAQEFDCGEQHGKWSLPAAEIPKEDVAQGRVLAILVHKLSYEERDRVPIFLARRGFAYTHIPGAVRIADGVQSDEQIADKDRELAQSMSKFLLQQWPERHTRNSLRGFLDAHNIAKNKIDRAVGAAIRLGLMKELPYPEGEKVGRQKTYLCPAEHVEM